jgi:hypothetical protein
MPKACTVGVAVCTWVLVEIVLQRGASEVVRLLTYVIKDSLLEGARLLVGLVAVLGSQCGDQTLPQRRLVVVAV